MPRAAAARHEVQQADRHAIGDAAREDRLAALDRRHLHHGRIPSRARCGRCYCPAAGSGTSGIPAGTQSAPQASRSLTPRIDRGIRCHRSRDLGRRGDRERGGHLVGPVPCPDEEDGMRTPHLSAAIGLSALLLAGLPAVSSAQDDEKVFYMVTHGTAIGTRPILVNDAAVQAGDELGVQVNVSFAANDVAVAEGELQCRHRRGRRRHRRIQPGDRRPRRRDAGRPGGRHPRGLHGHGRQGHRPARLRRSRPPRPRDDVGELPDRQRGPRRGRPRLDAGRSRRSRVPGPRDRGDRQRLRSTRASRTTSSTPVAIRRPRWRT